MPLSTEHLLGKSNFSSLTMDLKYSCFSDKIILGNRPSDHENLAFNYDKTFLCMGDRNKWLNDNYFIFFSYDILIWYTQIKA